MVSHSCLQHEGKSSNLFFSKIKMNMYAFPSFRLVRWGMQETWRTIKVDSLDSLVG